MEYEKKKSYDRVKDIHKLCVRIRLDVLCPIQQQSKAEILHGQVAFQGHLSLIPLFQAAGQEKCSRTSRTSLDGLKNESWWAVLQEHAPLSNKVVTVLDAAQKQTW